jgi:LEA14-like dessication related protein
MGICGMKWRFEMVGKSLKQFVSFFVLFFAAACVAGLLVSCSGMQVRPPDLFLQKMKIEKVGISGMQMVLTMDITNGNVQPITIGNFEYKIAINGHSFGKGYFSEPTAFKGLERKTVQSTLNINFFKLPAAIKSIFDENTVHASMVGRYHIEDRGRMRTLDFESEADIPVSK